jgi:hypothetical protein
MPLFRPITAYIVPGWYVAFKLDPHVSLAVLGDSATDYCTKYLAKRSKTYLGLVLEAHRIEFGCYLLTLSVVGPKPATLPQYYTRTLVPIKSRSLVESSIARRPVVPTLPLSYGNAYHYPKTICVRAAAAVFPEDYGLFPVGFPKLGEDDVERLKKYAKRDAPRIKALEAEAAQHCALQDLKPVDMAAEIAQVKTAIRLAPGDAFDAETEPERRERLHFLHHDTDPTLLGGPLHWEPVVTIGVNPEEVGSSLTPPEALDAEIALLRRCGSLRLVRLALLTDPPKTCRHVP